jgi:two-component system cell cycle sensor histidine kinase/response regulator CckA
LSKLLRVLHIEDSELDCELIRRHLTQAGYELVFHRVDTADAVKSALHAQTWDIVLADYSLPKLSGLDALSIVRESGLDIPFILISGTIGEELAVESLLAGADDYLMKDKLARLAPAIEREMDKVRGRIARRQAEDALKTSERELRAIFGAMTDLILVLDADGRCLRVAPNEAASTYRASEMIGKTAYDLYTVDKADFFLKHIRRALRERKPHRLEYSFGKRSSAWWFEASVSALSDQTVIWIARDITERKRAEEALRQSEERYRLLFESYPDPTYVFDVETLRLIAVNEAMVQHYGYLRDELLRMTVQDIWPAQHASAQSERLAQWQSTVIRDKEWKHQTKDGSMVDVEITSHPVFFDGRRSWVVQAQDVTTQKSLEAQLRQSQRMDAIGQLAGGIAHDFNNLLTIINGYCDLALDQMREDDPLRRNLEEVQKAGFRAASLTSRLLAFSRKQVVQPAIFKLNSVITDLEKMLHRLIGEDVWLRTVLDPELGSIRADHGQLEQVVMNLVINARDAMPTGGKLVISTANVDIDAAYAQNHIGVVPGPYVLLSVCDTGYGMDPQTQARIFEPFFTTKQPGKGTGLGLSTVYGIVIQWGGHIWVQSERGKGTTFEVYLPRVNHVPVADTVVAKSSETFEGTETILLVEDDQSVRSLARRLLENCGYHVIEAANGDDAIARSGDYPETIHLLVTDLVMPEISGIELSSRLRKTRDGLKVLYISGYTEKVANPCLQKPFTSEMLLSAVRSILNSSANKAARR